MVFESLVVDLINRFLGDYVENLDRSQLKLGIWGGDVNLKNLDVKESALDELDLPVKVISGHIGNLTLKIPWKNLYKAPVVAILDSVYVVAVPNKGVKYDEDKVEKAKQELKQKELKRIEDAKLKEATKGNDDKKVDTFAEKMVTQVIKNLQVKIMRIHIRYEDAFTNPAIPFSAGLTLHNLSFETTDENWRPCVLQEEAKMIHKVVLLDGLAIYLNSGCELFYKMSPESREIALEKTVATSKNKPKEMNYILGPINSVAQLKLNPKPELDGSNYTIPKVFLNIAMDEIALGVTKSQYQRLMEMLDSMDRMARSALYMKFRPEVALHGHAKSWWKFAMNCVLEEDIRRQRRNWSWRNMRNHRQLCRTYRDVYKEKLLAKKPNKEIESQIEAIEKSLDVFNITVARRQAEIEAAFLSKKDTKPASGGWFGGWFGGGKQEAKSESKGLEIAKKIEDAMTESEKSKLYEAIGYQENAAPTEYPHEFVENKVHFNLHSLTVSVVDDTSKYPHVLKAKLNKVEAKLDQRPSAAAMKVESSFKSFTVFGCPVDENNWPVLISSQTQDLSTSLLSVVYETNPIDKSCDQRVRVLSQSLEIAYNALTINQLVEVLKPPESLSLSQLQAAAALKLDDFKEMSAYGLQFAIERHQYLDLLVDLQPSIIIMPENGVYDDVGQQLMINLGNLKMSSFARNLDDSVTVRSLVKAGSTEDEILTTMMSEAYDKFEIKIENVAILMTASGLSWHDVENRQDTLHILQPMNLRVEFEKAIVTDDPRIPKMKLKGELPSLKISISDMKTMQLMKIATSIPTPESSSVPETTTSATTNALAENINAKALKQVTRAGALGDSESSNDKENVQLTDLDLTFNINEISLEVCRASGLNEETKMLSFALYDIGAKVVMRTHDMNVGLFLGGITMENLEFTNSDGSPLYILNTPFTEGSTEKLFTVNFLAVDKKAPNFSTTYESTLQRLSVTFTRLDVILHQEAILSVMAFANYLASNLQSTPEIETKPKPSFMDTNALKKYPSQLILSRAKKTEKEIINMKVNARMSSIGLVICNSQRKITSAQIAGLQADVLMDNSKISVNALLKSVLVSDPTPGAVYDKILSTVSGDVMDVAVVMYSDATEGLGYIDMKAVDMSVSLKVGRMKVVYLNKYIASILGFLDQFQVAKDKMAAASAAAAQVAKQGLEEAYEKATRVGLSLCLMAPVIVVPQSSKSLNALIADLGTMTLKNAFSTKEHRNELGFPSIFDTINLKIEDLKLSRVIMKKDDAYVVTGECLILEPLSLVLRIERNLTFSWCTECPEIDIKATLAAVNVSLTQEDYAMMMKTLSDNLGEAPDRPPDAQQEVEIEEKQLVTVVSDLHALPTDKKEGQDRIGSTRDSSYAVKRMKFHFVMDSCGAVLYTKSSNLESKMGLIERDPSKSLASVELKTMALSGEMFNDNSMWANVILVNCILDDTRATRKRGIRRLMEKTLQDDATANMVDVTYRLDAKKDTAIDVKVNNFTLIGCLEYLLILGNFFSTPPSEVPKETAVVPTEVVVQKSSSQQTTAKTPTSESSAQSATGSNSVSINLSLLKPDIVLIENIDDINSNAVIFNNEAFIKMKITPEGQNIQGTISGLELFTAKFNPKYRSSTMQQILNPCDINLTFNAFVQGDQRINVSITDVILHVNPATVQLLTNISSALTASSEETEANKIEIKKDPPEVVWAEKDIQKSKLWYLGTNQLKAALEVTEDTFLEVPSPPERNPSPVNEELMMLSINSILVTVEAGVGKAVVPLILLESKFRSEIRNWTSKLKIECFLSVEVASFNEKLAVWEPLIEPVETKTGHNPWELNLRVVKNDIEPTLETTALDDLDSPGSDDIVFKPPLMSIEVSSTDMLLVTVTKTCLEVITNLGKAFGQAMQKDSSLKLEQSSAPYVVKNNLGIPLMIVLEGTEFQVQSGKEFSPRKSVPLPTLECKEIQEVLLEPNTTVGIALKDLNQKLGLSSMRRQSSRMEYFFNLKVDTDQVSSVRTVYLTCTDKRYFNLPLKTYPGDQWGFIVSISSASGAKVINIHSVVQIVNHFQVPIEIFYMKQGSKETLESCGIVDPDKNFYVPCYALYTSKNELFFKPHEKDFAISSQPFVWKDLVKEPTFGLNMFCEGKEKKKKFFIQVAGEMEQVLYEHTSKKTMLSAGYKLHLSPPALLRNLLPIPISVAIQCINEEFTLKPGESVSLVNVEIGRHGIEIRMKDYLDLDWKCFKVVNDKMAELAVWSFEATAADDKKTTLDLGMRTELVHNSIIMSLYCPFWMVNRTGLTLTYRMNVSTHELCLRDCMLCCGSTDTQDESDADNLIVHPPENLMPVLFSFRAKSFFAKKKASVKIEESEWSDKFALDVVGSSGNVVTKTKEGKPYGVGVQIKLSSFGLTKLVIFTPFYILVNNTSKALQCQEVCEQSRWITVQSQDCSPFWPVEKKSLMRARYEDSTETLPFSFKEEHETLLRLKDRNYCGINVEVTVSDASIIINFTDFLESSAAKIVNYTPSALRYGQKGVEGELNSLAPGHLVLYAWQDPCSERELLWNCGGKNETHSLAKDGIGEVVNESGTKLYWVSFLDGMQRVLFVTDDVLLATNARSGELERVQQEIILSLDGFGLSLINNQINKEIMYFCVASTGVIWEGRKHNHNRFKALSLKDNILIENAYLSYNRDIEAKKTLRHRVILEKRMEIDFVDFTMIRPHKRVLRRSFQTGVWCSYKTSPHQTQLHAKINRLQIDNQLPDCIFPVILAPVPLSKSVAAESMPKPFVELSLVQRIPEQSTEIQYQYFRVLVQEFEVKLDLGFVNSILGFLAAEEEKSIDYEEKLALDKETAAIDLKGLAKDYFYQEQKSFFDNLHFSPLKVHLSFSMSGGVDSSDGKTQSAGIHSDFLNLLLQSIGVTITEVQDVIFKLNYFERNNSFMTNQQLINAAVSHYSSQAIKQFYVLLLGLDVIGNPVGLLLGIKSGIGDFFYEPIQGAIEGPEEFAEGLALGVKSLLGHTVGGAAGAVSRITGSLGKGLAALTMDKDYQRRRQQQINRRPQNAAQGMAQGGKNLVMGFVEGVTGVVTKPVAGAREEGFGGFMKGMGKGLIGIVARPTAGAIDFASGSLDVVKKAMDTSEEVKRVRLPRFIQPDTIIRPYVTFEAEGLRLLLDVEKGKFASTDNYVAHVPVTPEKKTFLMVTSQRIIFIEKGDVFGQWNAEWNYTWDEVKETPVITEKGIKILLKDHKKKTGFFGHTENGKIVCLKDPELCKFIITKMEEAMRNTLQERQASSKWSSTPSSSISQE